MAYTTTDAKGRPNYANNFAVGRHAPNKRDDVLLVQWMLHRIFTDDPAMPAPGDDLAVDGWAGEETTKWILAFQKFVRSRGRKIAADGRVDAQAAFPEKVITIGALNSELRRTSPAAAASPSSDTSCPVELLKALADGDDSAGPYQGRKPLKTAEDWEEAINRNMRP